MAKEQWQAYAKAMKEAYLILHERAKPALSIHAMFDKAGNVVVLNKFHRGIYRVVNQADLEALDRLTQEAQSLYYQAIAQSDGISLEQAQQRKLPSNFPKRLGDDVRQIIVHHNPAYSSVKYTKDDKDSLMVVADIDTRHLRNLEESIKHQQQLLEAPKKPTKEQQELVEALLHQHRLIQDNQETLNKQRERINKLIDDIGKHLSLTITKHHTQTLLEAPAHEVCALAGCSAIQHRIHTGSQHTANYYREQDGTMTKSKKSGLGVWYTSATHNVQISTSHLRKTRSDSLSLGVQDNEFIMEFIPKEWRVGRLFKLTDND